VYPTALVNGLVTMLRDQLSTQALGVAIPPSVLARTAGRVD
jgi:hypothetical protein